jgi:hypothetical protein
MLYVLPRPIRFLPFFLEVHGSAPDIYGMNIANPVGVSPKDVLTSFVVHRFVDDMVRSNDASASWRDQGSK